MASSFFRQFAAKRIAIAGAGIGTTGLTATEVRRRSAKNDPDVVTAASEQFHTSSIHPLPQGWTGRIWQIRNDYPRSTPPTATSSSHAAGLPPIDIPRIPVPDGGQEQDFPWLNVDFKTHPIRYCELVKEYCWEGNANNEFVVQNNTVTSIVNAANHDLLTLRQGKRLVPRSLDALVIQWKRVFEWPYV
jgi:hypothetical protein